VTTAILPFALALAIILGYNRYFHHRDAPHHNTCTPATVDNRVAKLPGASLKFTDRQNTYLIVRLVMGYNSM
jgi:hypothetical protein